MKISIVRASRRSRMEPCERSVPAASRPNRSNCPAEYHMTSGSRHRPARLRVCHGSDQAAGVRVDSDIRCILSTAHHASQQHQGKRSPFGDSFTGSGNAKGPASP